MDTQSEIERIRALYAAYQAAEYSSETDAACKALAAEVPGLLRMIERQQAVVDAAGAVWMDGLDCPHYFADGTHSYEVSGAAMDTLHDALAALEGGVDGE